MFHLVKASNALCETGDTSTHRSSRGSEPGICRTAVLWQDCTGSAIKGDKCVSPRAGSVFLMAG